MSEYSEESSFSEEYDDDDDFFESPVVVAKPKPRAKPRAAPKKAAKKKTTTTRKRVDKENDSVSEEYIKLPTEKKATTKKKGGGGNMARNAVGKEQKVEDVYQKLTQLEHVLLRPDTYIGSTELVEEKMWVWNSEISKMEFRKIEFAPGLYKIFDEILVNAADNKQRDASMKVIKVVINAEKNLLSVLNDGAGLPIVMHEKEDMYVPELVFGHLMAGANFNDEIDKVVGGRNGLGAKLTNIFSKEFTIRCGDGDRRKEYIQTWKSNMSKMTIPKIKSYSKKDYVQVEFKPDLKRFNLTHMTDDMVALFQKRVYDVAGCNPGVGVWLNGKKLKVRNFGQYIDLYPIPEKPGGGMFKRIIEDAGERWEIGVTVSPDGTFQQMSFVNSINTIRGGTHVNYLAQKIGNFVRDSINNSKRGKQAAKVNQGHVKNYMWLFVRCLVVNPAFDSQTKHTLTTKVSAFGSKPTLTEKFLKKVNSCGIKEYVLDFASFKAKKQLTRVGGKKTARITGVEKLDDANWAGTRQASKCTLILTEGDSAKTLAVSGLSVIGRDAYGVFPLRGKPLNVRDTAHSTVMKNKEFKAIMKILGLKPGTKYTSVNELRYGKVMIMADQDVDGSHIKGLIINMIHVFWPELLKLGFVVEFITPIVKVRKKKEEIPFFTLPEYEAWKEENDQKGWVHKYYKGLGTSAPEEARKYFSDLRTHMVKFNYNELRDEDAMLTAFAKSRADKRKEWIAAATEGDFLDTTSGKVSIKDFVDSELRLFSVEDNKRSIAGLMDGFKPSQRKVLFGCFKRNLSKDVKVAQLSGYISEHAAYHHGEVSLQGTIVNMAQTFVGSNNINLLFPSGQFGSRLMGGKDSSAARYIFTRLSDITRTIFHPDDDAVLNYLEDDGMSIEPDFYAPVIPMVLVNGSQGIGSGWSTTIPNYNPRDIVDNLRRMLAGEPYVEMAPWYRGFLGTIEKKDWAKKAERGGYVVHGVYEMEEGSNTLQITELPIQSWTSDYKSKLNKWSTDYEPEDGAKKKKNTRETFSGFVEDFKEYHTDTHVDFQVSIVEEKLTEVMKRGVEKVFKLTGSIATTNMVLYDDQGRIQKYDTTEDIMRAYFQVRMEIYRKRKEWLIDKYRKEWDVLDNKVRFIEAVANEEVVVTNRKKAKLVAELEKFGFMQKEGENNFDYLLSMAIWSLTKERADAIREQLAKKKEELDEIINTPVKDLWLNDLDAFDEAYDKWLEEMHERESQEVVSARVGKKTKRKTKAKAKPKPRAKAVTKKPVAKKSKQSTLDFKAPAKPAAKRAAPTKKATTKKKLKKVASPPPTPQTPASGLDLSIYDYSDDDGSDLDGLSDLDLEEMSDEVQILDFSPIVQKSKSKGDQGKKARKKRKSVDYADEDDEEVEYAPSSSEEAYSEYSSYVE